MSHFLFLEGRVKQATDAFVNAQKQEKMAFEQCGPDSLLFSIAQETTNKTELEYVDAVEKLALLKHSLYL